MKNNSESLMLLTGRIIRDVFLVLAPDFFFLRKSWQHRRLLFVRWPLLLTCCVWWGASLLALNAQTVVQVSGTISTDTTWTSDKAYHVVDDVTVQNGATLTIEAGTVVKFAKRRAGSQYEEVKLQVEGGLWAKGTAGSKITLTSIDDPQGGSAGGDGTPDSTDWGWIEFRNNSEDANCLLEYCVIRYGGNDYYYSSGQKRNETWAVRCLEASPTIRNCEFRECRRAIYGTESGTGFCRLQIWSNSFYRTFDSGSYCVQFESTATPVISGNTFAIVGSAIDLSGGGGTVTDNTFTLSGGGTGIYAGSGAATVTGNTLSLTGGGTGINSGLGASLVVGNTLDLNGASGTGLVVGGGPATVSTNNVSGGALGIECLARSTATVQGNAVVDALTALKADLNHTVAFSGNSYTGIGFKGLQVAGTLTASQTWGASQLTALGLDSSAFYHVVDDVTVQNGATLTIEAGTVVKFAKRRAGSQYEEVKLQVEGGLWAKGTAGSKITLTSIDDPQGGSAGGDGTPDSTDWGWIEFRNNSEDANCLLEYCVIRYGGNDYYYSSGQKRNETWAVRCLEASPTIRNCHIADSRNGVYCSNGQPTISRNLFADIYQTAIEISFLSVAGMEPRILANTFEGCPTAIKYTGSTSQGYGRIAGNFFLNGQTAISVSKVGSSLEVLHNQFVGITTYGIQNTDATGTVLAQGNWWGSSTGPGGVAGGTGAPVSSYVNYANWWTSPNQTPDGVWNVIAIRKGGTMLVDIYYDLIGTAPSYSVTIEASKTGGNPYTFTVPTAALSGARGSGVTPGENKHAIWDSSIGNTGPYTDLMRIKVTADLE